MYARPTRVPLYGSALCLAACSAAGSSTNTTPDASAQAQDSGTQGRDAAPDAQLDAASLQDAGELEPVFECDAGPGAASSDAIFFRAKHACERTMPALFGKCGTFHLTFDQNGRASDLTLDETFGPLPKEYVTCILNELSDEAYGCLAATTIDPYESCTTL